MADNWHQARLDHRAQQSEAIASAALSLILENGASAITMAAIATESGISRQTLYRHYADVDAVLVGIAELVISHDDEFQADVLKHTDPASQLDHIIRTVGQASGHETADPATLRTTLPPRARELLAEHERRAVRLLADVLRAGIEDEVFREDVEPLADAPLILGLAAVGHHEPERAVLLVRRIVERNPKENRP